MSLKIDRKGKDTRVRHESSKNEIPSYLLRKYLEHHIYGELETPFLLYPAKVENLKVLHIYRVCYADYSFTPRLNSTTKIIDSNSQFGYRQ
jgi:hypothetical protein